MRQILYFFICTIAVSLAAEQGSSSFVPSSVDDSDFRSLTAQSPFTRSIDLSDSLILTGIATMNDSRVATLLNKETKETYVVSSKANSQGWKMVELKEDSDLEKVSADTSRYGNTIRQIISNNLTNSGLFYTVNEDLYIQSDNLVEKVPRFEDWKLIKAQFLLSADVTKTDKGIRLRMRLYDVFNAKEIEKLQLTIPDEGLIRRVGHTVRIFSKCIH